MSPKTEDFDARQKMLAAVEKAVALIKAACPDHTMQRQAAAFVIRKLAWTFCEKNRITESTLELNLSLRDLFLRDLLRKKKIEIRHQLFVRHIFSDEEEAAITGNGSGPQKQKKKVGAGK